MRRDDAVSIWGVHDERDVVSGFVGSGVSPFVSNVGEEETCARDDC